MDENDAESEPAPAPAPARRPSLLRSMIRGAEVGVRLLAYVVVPIAAIMLLFGLSLAAFGLGSSRSWSEVPANLHLPWVVVIAFGFGLAGLGLGAFAGLVAGLIRLAVPGRGGAVGDRLAQPILSPARRPATVGTLRVDLQSFVGCVRRNISPTSR